MDGRVDAGEGLGAGLVVRIPGRRVRPATAPGRETKVAKGAEPAPTDYHLLYNLLQPHV